MATQSVRIGWRPYVTAQQLQTANLLDSYSDAAAAYSLRKLRSSYSGSAIRVRRSSDNTELNIGFDSDGNLDTIALSSFVGSGSGFVTTWYDQTGNNFNRTQTTAAAQPNIVYLGAINMVNGKPAMYFDGTSTTFALQGPKIGETYQGAGYSSTVLNVTKLDSSYSTTNEYPLFGGMGWYDSRFSINSNKWYLINTGTGISSTVNASANQVVSSVIFAYTTDKVRINGTEVISGSVGTNGGTDYNYIGRSYLGKFYKGYFQEHIIYASDKTSVISAMESNMNTYYSAYPNPTSVWNLLNAVYNADTTASSSLKTSLFASYNGESNTNDSKGTNNGTAQGGLTYTTGKIGNAFTFNGSNSYVSLPRTTNQFDFTDFSISAWFNPSLTTSGTIFSNYHYINNSNQYGYLLYLQSGKIRFAIYQGTTSPVVGFNGVNIGQSSLNIATNTWYHIVITKTASNDFKMYINGSLQSLATISGSLNANPVYNSLNRVDIGSQWGVWSLFNGKIDALNTWAKELTASEVSELYNSGNGAQYIGDNFYKPTTNDALLVNNGTAQGGLTYEVGKVGTAFSFNGTNAYIELGDVMDVGTSSWSYTFWFKTFDAVNSGICFSKSFAGGNSGRFWGGPYNNRFAWNFQAGSNVICTETNNGTILPNTWYHVVCVLDRNDKLKLYINGTLASVNVTSGTNNLTPYLSDSFNTTHPFRIGAYTDSNNITPYGFFKGQIDAFNVWSRVLTATEVTELYNSGNGKQYPN